MPVHELVGECVVRGGGRSIDRDMGEPCLDQERAEFAGIAQRKRLLQRGGTKLGVDRPRKLGKERILVKAAPGRDDHFPTRGKDARHLNHGTLTIWKELQPMLAEEQIKRGIREWQLLRAALYPFDRVPFGSTGACGRRQHGRAEIEASDGA